MSTVTETAAPADRLDRFLPRADVRERHEIVIRAPAHLVFDLAKRLDLRSVAPVRAIFRLRELLLGGHRTRRPARGLVDETLALGWGVLEEEPGRFFAAGAVCQPWRADVVFEALEPSRFARYAEPGRVRIVWTLEARPLSPEVDPLRHRDPRGRDGRRRPDPLPTLLAPRGPGGRPDSQAPPAGPATGGGTPLPPGPGSRSSPLIRLHHTGEVPPGSESRSWNQQEKEKQCPNC